MPLAAVLANFQTDVTQCDRLISNAHIVDAIGNPVLPAIDRQQITVAGFLNMFIAWESFLEAAISEFMMGMPTINGTIPVKYATPLTTAAANQMLLGTTRYVDYANHENVQKLINIYFQNGYPFEPHVSSIFYSLADLRTMRNSCAHISTSTQTKLENLALRILGSPQVGITIYQLLTAADPRSRTGETILANYKNILLVTAELISNG